MEVLSVSVDSHFVHKMWNDDELSKMVEGGVPFHMVADQAGNLGRAFGVWDETQGIEMRGRFIIDPDGVIQAMEVLTPPVGRKLAETIRQIQAYQVTGQADPQAGAGSGRESLGGLESIDGIGRPRIVRWSGVNAAAGVVTARVARPRPRGGVLFYG